MSNEEWRGKGSYERPSTITKEIKELRHELIFSKDEDRKKEVKRRLIELGNIKDE